MRQILILTVLATSVSLVSSFATRTQAQSQGPVDVTATQQKIAVPRTESPRGLLTSFIALRDDLERTVGRYQETHTASDFKRLQQIARRLRMLIDLSRVPDAERWRVGQTTSLYLLDILGRIGVPNLDAVPDEAAFDEADEHTYRIPDTPLRVTRVEEGNRRGEFLFDAGTVLTAPRFYPAIADIPLRSELDIESWSNLIPQMTGPLIHPDIVAAVPEMLKTSWRGTPVWKVLFFALTVIIAAIALARIFRWVRSNRNGGNLSALAWRTSIPFAMIVLASIVLPFVSTQLLLSGDFARLSSEFLFLVNYLSFAVLFWLGTRMFFEWLILSAQITDGSQESSLLRLFARLIGIFGVVAILAYAGQLFGLPVLSMVAGLGIGGLAVALAIRPTLENLIGGIILYVDKRVRVGDFCSFEDNIGVVERIGMRSTEVRGLDRTLISIPNAQFADMKLVNWARCDRILIDETIGVRYETDPDQLRYLLAEIRRMLHAHPRISADTIRVRFKGYGDSALLIWIRVYAETREWNDFFAIKEDVLLRLYDVVIASGSSFAFPSQTVYFGRDSGLDQDKIAEVKSNVDRWRRTGRLPFPRLPAWEVERLKGTLDYPPRGSPEVYGERPEEFESAERLSEATFPEEEHAVAAEEEDSPKKGT